MVERREPEASPHYDRNGAVRAQEPLSTTTFGTRNGTQERQAVP